MQTCTECCTRSCALVRAEVQRMPGHRSGACQIQKQVWEPPASQKQDQQELCAVALT